MKNRNIIVILIIALIFSNMAFFAVGYNYANSAGDKALPSEQIKPNTSHEEFIDKLDRITAIVDEYYFNEYDWEEIHEQLYRDLIFALGDQYSEYLSPRDIEDLYIRSGRSYGGIGVEVSMNNGRVTVVTPMEGGPGQKAGLLPGDAIVEVDGDSVEGLSLSEAVDLIRGEPDTEVVLGIHREGRRDIIRVPIVRGIITTTSVSHKFLEKDLGYIRLSRFTEGSDKDFKNALNDLESQGLESLIIDLRGNPGGYLDVVVNIANLLVPKGEVVYMENKHGERTRTYLSELEERDFEVVVLVDEYSASASEILAGALKDSDSATIVGKTTFGKGSVQSLFDLEDGSAVKLTFQKYFTPSGVVIDGVGVSPHIEVDQPDFVSFSNLAYKGKLEIGSTGLDVIILHKILYYLGYGEDTEDSLYTDNTKDVVMRFQKANGLNVTGAVDIKTADKINERFSKLQKDNDEQLKKAIEIIKEGNGN